MYVTSLLIWACILAVALFCCYRLGRKCVILPSYPYLGIVILDLLIYLDYVETICEYIFIAILHSLMEFMDVLLGCKHGLKTWFLDPLKSIIK